jgi:hypothetical protein|tara:strand:- start:957 stop:1373 length:417 start_codon:yes stop_codon:yes gene_type:complete
MSDEFYGVIKLVTGEEIFALCSVDDNNGTPMVLVQSPVTMKVLSNGTGQYVKVKPWLELATEDIYLINYERIITMSEVKDKKMIEFYDRYLEEDDVDVEIDGKVSINEKMGYLSTVSEARKMLEKLYNTRKDATEDPT